MAEWAQIERIAVAYFDEVKDVVIFKTINAV